ncbi:MAG: TlpA disulfide reductase family protein [Polyangiaceae bacterium]
MIELAQRFGTRGLRVMGVTMAGENDEERTLVLDAAHEEKMSWPTLLDPDAEWWTRAEVGHQPVFLIFGKDGKLTYRHSGRLLVGTDGYNAMAKAIESALGPS